MRLLTAVLLCSFLPLAVAQENDADDTKNADTAKGHAFFETHIRPLLIDRCYDCHSVEAGKQKGGLLLDRRSGWETGGDSGPAIIPSDPASSLLLTSVRYRDEHLQMPPKSKLPAEEIALLEEWVWRGAPDPRDETLDGVARSGNITESDINAARQQWPYNPLQAATEHTIDDHLSTALAANDLEPNPLASPRERLRRLHHDLTGLPPTHAEVRAFEADPSPAAWAARVADLLDRPGFGETWGRHWLDVARYADSNGGDRNFTFHQAWRYRNLVIDTFNRDVPYYTFVRNQIAGDLYADPPEKKDDHTARDQALIASTFLSLGPKMLTERDREKLAMDTADEQIDTIGRAFLGLTLGCARCHDHKFDPITQRDYYALAGIFRSTKTVYGTHNGNINTSTWNRHPLGENPDALAKKIHYLNTVMRLSMQADYRPKPNPNAKKGPTDDPNTLPFGGLILDNTDADVTGPWRKSTHAKRFHGKNYLVHHINESPDPKRITFRAALPTTGTYEVRVAYVPGNTRHPAVPIRVHAKTLHQVTLNQRKAPKIEDHFQPIGRFKFEKGVESKIIIEPDTKPGYILIDALQFIHVDDIPGETKALAAARVPPAADGKPAIDPNSIEALHFKSKGELNKLINKLIKEFNAANLAMAPADLPDAADTPLRVRGVTHALGDLVPRGIPVLFQPQNPHKTTLPTGGKSKSQSANGWQPAFDLPHGVSGRRQLADWITSPENPLLDRVLVNRVWHHLMGHGLVRTVDNFGVLGDKPTHPELLDDLARNFRESGGSIKTLITRIVTSAAYQRAATPSDALAADDPENRLHGHQNRRRLTAEELRDTLLLAAGRLDRTPQHATARSYSTDIDAALKLNHKTYRAVYLPVARNNTTADRAVFDVANPDFVTGTRPRTTVPTQALYLLNSPFVATQAKHLAKRAPTTEALYQTAFQRQPTKRERDRATTLAQTLGKAQAHLLLAEAILSSTEFQFLD